MQPLSQLDASQVLGVLTDIDDTLTTHGALTGAAYCALARLKQAGFAIVPVTGRSAGWAHMIIRTWPVDAVIAESGGLYLYRDPARAHLLHRYYDDEARVRADRLRLAQCADRVLAAVPGLRPASDNAYRLVDLALDYCEEVPRVADPDVRRAIDLFVASGFSARASSVHINAWAGQFDKGPTALRCLAEVFAGSPLASPARWLCVGDAPNDESMFEAFALSVGVANIAASLDRLAHPPAFVTQAECGAGFVELADHLIRSRSAGIR